MESLQEVVGVLLDNDICLVLDKNNRIMTTNSDAVSEELRNAIDHFDSEIKALLHSWPLCDEQKRLYELSVLGLSTIAILPICLKSNRALDHEALLWAWRSLAKMYPVLACELGANNDSGYLFVQDTPENIVYLDRDYIVQDITDFINKNVSRCESLASKTLSNLFVFPNEDERSFRLVIVVNRLAVDKESIVVIKKDFVRLYQSAIDGEKELELRTSLFPQQVSIHQEARVSSNPEQDKLAYWREMIGDNLSDIDISPSMHRKTSRKAFYESFDKPIEQSCSSSLQKVVKSTGVSFESLTFSLFNLLLAKHSNQKSVISCLRRPLNISPNSDDAVGVFKNLFPIKVNCSGGQDIRELLVETHHRIEEVHQQGSYFAWRYINDLDLTSEEKQSVLRYAFFCGHKADRLVGDHFDLQSFSLEHVAKEEHDLLFSVIENGTEITINIQFDGELYSRSFIECLADRYLLLLNQLISDQGKSLSDFSIVSDDESRVLLEEFNNTNLEIPANVCIHELFSEQVEKCPDRIAVRYGDQSLSYRALYQRSKVIADHLQSAGLQPDELVGVCIDRSEQMVVALLGVLLAGGAYVPVDPNYPDERIAYILRDSLAKTVLTETSQLMRLEGFDLSEVQFTCIDQPLLPSEADGGTSVLAASVFDNNLAYVIYTSGSTGDPKGVAIEHRSAVALIRWAQEVYSSDEINGVLGSTSICFDLSVYEIFYTLSSGGTVILVDDALELDAFQDKNDVTLINTVPSAVDELLRLNAIPDSVKTINLAGEPLAQALVDKLYEQTSVNKVYDLYGPSEDTTYSTFTLREKNGQANIGVPIANSKVYILDQHHQLQALGVPGELCISGQGLARGYLGRTALTAEKFVPNPFWEGQRLYKTGDVAKWLPNGHLQYLGRMDHQVKIRGFRIEIGEIESRLNALDAIQEAVVIAKGQEHKKKLVCFYVLMGGGETNSAFSSDGIVEALSETLPAYMIPTAFMSLDGIPLTQNGKIDRRKLELMEIEAEVSSAYQAPSSAVEQQLALIWSRILDRPEQSIGIHDDFFGLGGHSLLAMRLISSIRDEFEIKFSQKDLFSNSSIAALAKSMANAETESRQPIPHLCRDSAQTLPLSFNQQRLWLLEQLDQNTAYKVSIGLKIDDEIDIFILEKSFQAMINRYEILRTNFLNKNGKPEVLVSDVSSFAIKVNDISSTTSELIKKERVEQLIYKDIDTPFVLAKGPLLKVRSIKLDIGSYVLIVDLHHIIADDWSLGILLDEVFENYQTLLEGKALNQEQPLIQHLDYSVWQKQEFSKPPLLENKLKYWQEKLSGVKETLDFPTDYPRPSELNYAGSSIDFSFDEKLSGKINQLVEQQSATLYMVLLAAVKVLLFRYTEQSDICVGGVFANRQRTDVENIIGMLVNTLPLRSNIDSDVTFNQLLSELKTTCLDAYEHQDTPFEKIVEHLSLNRSMSHNPLFQIMVILQNVPIGILENDNVELISYERPSSKFDITIEFTHKKGIIAGTVEYATSLYKPETIERLVNHLSNLFTAITELNERPISELDYLNEEERRQVITDFNSTQSSYPSDYCIHDFFTENVKNHPDRIAVKYEDHALSYQELHDLSFALALYLQDLQVKPDTVVGLFLERSLEMMVGIQGVFISGGAYVPLDPDYPDDRLAYMVDHSDVKIILTQKSLTDQIRRLVPSNTHIIELDEQFNDIENRSQALIESGVELLEQARPNSLAYVIYTSGSTGRPKGVMVEHRALVNRIYWMQKTYQLSEADVVLQKTPYSFDVSVWEFVWPMMAGASLVFAAPGGHKDVQYLQKTIHANRITTLHFVPSMLNSYLEHSESPCQSVRQVICSGEALGKKAVDQYQWAFPNARLHNLYGPTEAAIDVTAIDCTDLNRSLVPIGSPIDNIQIYILDKQGYPQPLGVSGELHIAGVGLARGYYNRPELTEEKFIDNPFSEGQKMYKSGDLARWLEDGSIEYLGRIDTQVKLRGLRIEIGEIESQLALHTDVKDCAVVVKGKGLNKRLVAYYVAKGSFGSSGDLSEVFAKFLSKTLPEFMVPVRFIALGVLPKTPSGKLDRKELIQLSDRPNKAKFSTQLSDKDDHRSDDIASLIVGIWSKELNLSEDEIDKNSNFFFIGGNSLSVVSVASQIEKALHIPFSPVDIFKNNTVNAITQSIVDSHAVLQQDTHSSRRSKSGSLSNMKTDEQVDNSLNSYPDYYNESLAIIGVSCQFPDASDHRAYWQNLLDEQESIAHISIDEADQQGINSRVLEDPNYVPVKTWLDGKELFDPEFFKISAGNAALMDPQYRLLLMHSWRAVEDAGYRHGDIEKTSVYVTASNHFYQSLGAQLSSEPGVLEDSNEFLNWLNGQGGTIPTMISYQLGFKGPSAFVHTNCSSSLTGLYFANQSLQSGDSDYALVGAASLSASLKLGYLYQPGLNLSSDGHTKAFDAKADGLVEGEGVGVVLVKRAVDAVRDNDNIYALIRGIGVNNDGADKAGFYAPSISGQSEVIQKVLTRTGVHPESIHYVEAHGTGTALGDPIELAALTEAYQKHSSKNQYCAIGSVKSNIGHLDAAAGLAGCIKLAMSLSKGTVPATINYTSPNPKIDFANSPFYVLGEAHTWDRDAGVPFRAALSAFGIGGTNTHVIFEEYPSHQPITRQANAETQNYLVPLSAKKEGVLKEYAKNVLTFLLAEEGTGTDNESHIADIAYTLQVGRCEMDHRLALLASDHASLILALQNFLDGKSSSRYVSGSITSQKSTLGLLEQDEDFEILVQQWVRKNKISKLATLWIDGAVIDWRALGENDNNRRISLPTYPFEKKPFWFEQKQTRSVPNVERYPSNTFHPLLHSNTSDFSKQRYSSKFTGSEFFLRDHVIQNTKILPAVIYLEMARAAIEQAQPKHLQSAVFDLTDIVWTSPFIPEQHESISIALTMSSDKMIAFEVSGEEQGSENVHCQGKALLTEREKPIVDIEAIMDRINGEEVRGHDLYTAFESMGTDFGSTFRSVKYAKHGDEELLAAVFIPEKLSETMNSFSIHPSIVDGALQAGLLLSSGPGSLPSDASLPFALESLRYFGECEREMFAWIRFTPTKTAIRNSTISKIDVDLFDNDGRVAIQLRGHTTRAMSYKPQINDSIGSLFAVQRYLPSPITQVAQPEYANHKIVSVGFPQLKTEELVHKAQGEIVKHTLSEKTTSVNIAHQYQELARLLFEFLRELISSKPHGKTLVQVLLPQSTVHEVFTGLMGLFDSATLENPAIVGQIIFAESSSSTETLSDYLKQNKSEPANIAVNYQNGIRHLLEWQPLDDASTPLSSNIPFKDNGVYLITGGLGALGRIFAKEILEQTSNAKIILTGRQTSPHEFRALLDGLGELSNRLFYKQLDIVDQSAVATCISDVEEQHGVIRGVLHTAGMISDNFIFNKSSEEFENVLSPKVAGTAAIDNAIADLKIDFFALFSSESSLGSMGQSDYACANGFMNHFSRERNQRVAQGICHGSTLAVCWPLWRDGGMHLDQDSAEMIRKTTGMLAMDTETGLRAFYQCLEKEEDYVLLTHGELGLMRERLSARSRHGITNDVKPAVKQQAHQEESDPLIESFDEKELLIKTKQYLVEQFSGLFKLAADEIDPTAPLENYGIDSILAINLTNKLEETFGQLSKTLFFEYQTIGDLAEYFVEDFSSRLNQLLFANKQEETVVQLEPNSQDIAVIKGASPLAFNHSERFIQNDSPRTAASTLSDIYSQPKAQSENEPIAIIGLSGRYPESSDIESYWNNLRDGKDCIVEIPAERWDWRDYFSEDITKEGSHLSKVGGFIEGVDEFDAKFFNISPREAEILDPQERIFLQHAWMAIEDAGYTRKTLQVPRENGLSGQVGVYVGVMYGEYQLLGAEASLKGQRMGFANSLADIANRVSYMLNVHGPSFTIDTMCSSSITSVHLACQDLKHGRTDLAIAGGVNLNIHPNKYLILSSGRYVSIKGHCHSFGADGDGYIPGEGVGAVLLKRLSEAEASGDHIYAVIKGSYTNHGGKTNGYTVPNPIAQATVVGEAIKEANVDPRHISYIEAHGTGTKLGDPIEITALSKAFYKDLEASEKDVGFCLIGSVKSNIGHCEPAAGIAGITKVLLQMKHKKIVPSLHSTTLNPNIDFESTPFVVNQELQDWQQPIIDGEVVPRIAGISSFGAGGANGHIVIQEYEAKEKEVANYGADFIIPLSAKSLPQLQQKVSDLHSVLLKKSDSKTPLSLASIAYTLQVGREAMEQRLCFLVKDHDELLSKLKAYTNQSTSVGKLHQARIKDHKKDILKLNQDIDIEQRISNWIKEKEFDSLMDLWARGFELDWQQFYSADSAPERVSLPTYPFAKNRHWVTIEQQGVPSLLSTKRLHPVLHENTSTFNEQRFSGYLSGSEPFLARYVNDENAYLPATVYLDMARFAVEKSLHAIKESQPVQLRNLIFGRPLPVGQKTDIACAVVAGNGNHTHGFEIYSQASIEQKILVQGYASALETDVSKSLEIGSLKGTMKEISLNGKLTKGLSSVHQLNGQYLIELSSDTKSEDGLGEFFLLPDMLENVLRIAKHIDNVDQWLSNSKKSDGLVLVESIGSVNLHHPCRSRMFAFIQQGSQGLVSISLYDEEGAFCSEINNVKFFENVHLLETGSAASRENEGSLVKQEHSVSGVENQFRKVPLLTNGRESGVANTPFLDAIEQLSLTRSKPDGVQLLIDSGEVRQRSAGYKPEVLLVGLELPVTQLDPEASAPKSDRPYSDMITLFVSDAGIYSIEVNDNATNDLGEGLIAALASVLNQIEQQGNAKVVLLKGNNNHFLSDTDKALNSGFEQGLYERVISFPHPIIAVLEGDANGAGLLLASMCDFMLIRDDGKYQFFNESNIKNIDNRIVELLRERFDTRFVDKMLRMTSSLRGQEWKQLGLSCPSFDKEPLLAEALLLAERISRLPQNPVGILKQHLSRKLFAIIGSDQGPANKVAVKKGQNRQTAKIASQVPYIDTDSVGDQVLLVTFSNLDEAISLEEFVDSFKFILESAETAGVEAIVLASQHTGFLPIMRSNSREETLQELAQELLNSSVVTIAALENSASDDAWLLAQCCDSCIHSLSGEYSINYSEGALESKENLGLIHKAYTIFESRLGDLASKQIVLLDGAATGEQLAYRYKNLRAAPQGQVRDLAIDTAEKWIDSQTQVLASSNKVEKEKIAKTLAKIEFDIEDEQPLVEAKKRINLSSEVIEATVYSNGVLLVKMVDREARNMHSDSILNGVIEVFDYVEKSNDAKVVILTGYDNYFSTGGTKDDLIAIQEGKAKFTDVKIYHIAMACKLPVIAAMQGHAVGAGWALGMFADFSIFSEESKYLSPYLNFGFTPGAGATYIFPEKLSFDLARETLMTAQELSGLELKNKGFNFPIAARNEVLDLAFVYANRLANLPLSILRQLKQTWTNSKLDLVEKTYLLELAMHDKTLVGESLALEQIQTNFVDTAGLTEVEESPNLSGTKVAATVTADVIAMAQDVAPTEEVSHELKQLLAQELFMDEDDIDEDTQFVDLGLDSIYGVTWVRKINDRFDLAIEAITVYSYPTLSEFSEFVVGEIRQKSPDQNSLSEIVVETNTPIDDVQYSELPETTVGAGGEVEKGVVKVEVSNVLSRLRAFLADELHMEEDEVDDDAQFVDLGLDSIYGVTWVRKINDYYELSIEAITVYSHPTLREFSVFVGEELTSAGIMPEGNAIEQLVSKDGAENSNSDQKALESKTSGLQVDKSTYKPEPPAVKALTSISDFNFPILTSLRNELNSIKGVRHKQPSTITDPIAIIGMAGQFPKSNDLTEFWENLVQGQNCVTEVPRKRWDIDQYYQEGNPEPGKTNGKWMGALEEYDLFDPLFFNISPLEAENMDPQQRLFLQTSWHSIENAGYNPKQLSGSKCGVFVGCASGDYQQFAADQQLSAMGFTGNATSILAARISYFLDLQGPCLSIETACSSSLVAIANACESLNAQSSDIALAGGVHVMSSPSLLVKSAQSAMLSDDGKCFTFDHRANGFVPGEGVGVLMLKRLEDAEKDEDFIQGVISGWGINQDGKTNGITAPNPKSQARLQQSVYEKFEIDPEEIQLIEAHGTGTKLGDPIEVNALKNSFKDYTDKTHYCALGSVKSNIGHCVTAAGVASTIKVLLALKNKQLPPTINFEKLNEHINLDKTPFYVNDKLQEWQVAENKTRRAAISSFGFSGTNAHLVIEEYRASEPLTISEHVPEGNFIIPLSANTDSQLLQLAINLRRFIEHQKDASLEQMAYTLQVGRDHMSERMGLIVGSIEELTEKLQAFIDGDLKRSSAIRGRVVGKNKDFDLLNQYQDVRDNLLETWIKNKELNKLLDFWVKGLAIDWVSLYQNKPKRMVLPNYPFAKERYWLEEQGGFATRFDLIENQPSRLHPLVHQNVSTMDQQRYYSRIDTEDFFIRDHKIALNSTEQSLPVGVLPGMAYLEMAYTAVSDAIQVAEEDMIMLRNIAWAKPLVVDEARDIAINLFDNDGQADVAIDIEVTGFNVALPESHFVAQAIVVKRNVLPTIDIESIQASLQPYSDASAIYQHFANVGLHYGPSHQAISSLHIGDEQVLATLKLSELIKPEFHEFGLHPSLLDCSLQAAAGLAINSIGSQENPSIPFALDNLQFISRCSDTMYSWVRYSDSEAGGSGARKIDIDLIDEFGNVCVRMHGFSTRDLQPTNEVNNQAVDQLDQSVFEPDSGDFNNLYYQDLIQRIINNEISAEEAVQMEVE